ncbi:glycosyltransferase family 4 protein [Lentilitoribacter sp. EG35]|uniref:glycosyltransferase family 4 protein n=1 Tax=Lentilitoribacter sp. EG35 TaxID=3234192 RepID=UPI003460686C
MMSNEALSQEPLRIIHCFRSPVGGIFRHVRDLVNTHHAQGHKIGILCDSSTGGEFEEKLFESIIDKLELGLIRMPIRRAITPGDLIAIHKVYKQIKSLQPDILHGHGAKGGAYVRVIGSFMRGSRSRVTRTYSPHGGSLHYDSSNIKGKAIFALERLLARMTDAIIFVSDHERLAYIDKVGLPISNSHLVYNGLNEEEFQPIATNENASDFLYIGMMRDLKGPDVFIDAFRKAEQHVGRPLHATMVGDGPNKQAYQEKIAQMGLSKRIVLHPAMNAREAFALAQSVVIPSRAEAMPYIVLETVAANKPIISTNVGGIPEILGADSDVMVPPGNVEKLAEKMTQSIQDKSWLASAQPDRNTFKKRFSVQAMAEDVLEIYHSSSNKVSEDRT